MIFPLIMARAQRRPFQIIFAAKPLQKTTRNAIFQRSYVNKLEISKNRKIF